MALPARIAQCGPPFDRVARFGVTSAGMAPTIQLGVALRIECNAEAIPSRCRDIANDAHKMSKKLIVYRIAKLAGLFALFRVATRSRVRILCYHGASMADESDYNPKLFISPRTFRSRIEWLRRKRFSVAGLERAFNGLERDERLGRLPTVITFDDGWHSTAACLLPVLAEYRMPSTLYLCTSHFLEGWPVVAVAVNYLLWKSTLRSVDVVGFAPAFDGHYRLDEDASRRAFHANACAWLTHVAPSSEAAMVARITRLGALLALDATDLALETRRFSYVSLDELRTIASQGCDIELHGHVHHYPDGDPEAFRADLATCSDTIVAAGLPRPQHYCYPSGTFDRNAAAVLAGQQVKTATTCVPGLVTPNGQAQWQYFLPRFLDGENIDMLVFESEMSGFAHFVRWLCGRAGRAGGRGMSGH